MASLVYPALWVVRITSYHAMGWPAHAMKLSPAARVSNKGWMVGCAKSTRVPPMRRSIQFSNQ